MEEAKWVCLSIGERYSGQSGYGAIRVELQRIFGERLRDILIIGENLGEDRFENALESYVFVRCVDIYGVKAELKSSKYVARVLNSLSDIRFVDEGEIAALRKNWAETVTVSDSVLRFGDIVKVRSGVFENLFGIVMGRNAEKDVYEVLFRLCLGYKQGTLSSSNLVFYSNLLEMVKVPVV